MNLGGANNALRAEPRVQRTRTNSCLGGRPDVVLGSAAMTGGLGQFAQAKEGVRITHSMALLSEFQEEPHGTNPSLRSCFNRVRCIIASSSINGSL